MKLLLIRGKIFAYSKIQLMNFTVFFQTKFGLHEFSPCIVYMNLFVYDIRKRDRPSANIDFSGTGPSY